MKDFRVDQHNSTENWKICRSSKGPSDHEILIPKLLGLKKIYTCQLQK